jgi:hypothetical protein
MGELTRMLNMEAELSNSCISIHCTYVEKITGVHGACAMWITAQVGGGGRSTQAGLVQYLPATCSHAGVSVLYQYQ